MKEKGGAELECGKSLRYWGWQADPVRDAVICPNCGYIIYPDAKPGTFDFEAWVPLWDQKKVRHIYVEVKAGDTRIDFIQLRDSQLKWAKEAPGLHDERIDLWFWLCIGRGIGYKKYPRESFLIPYEMWHQVQRELDRKSIPHGYEALEKWKLEWVICGDGLWLLPDEHPARTVYGYQTGQVNGRS